LARENGKTLGRPGKLSPSQFRWGGKAREKKRGGLDIGFKGSLYIYRENRISDHLKEFDRTILQQKKRNLEGKKKRKEEFLRWKMA